MRRILTSLMFIASVYSFAQVGVSKNATDTPRATLDVRAMGGATPDGILIPNVSKSVAESMPTPTTSTLVYIGDVSASGGSRTGKVDVVGFYYFDGTEWVKLGGGVGSSTSATVPFLGPVKGSIRLKTLPLLKTDWLENDFTIVVTGTGTISLPDPGGANSGRIISVKNGTGLGKNYGDNAPLNNSTIDPQFGHILQSDGTNWYLIGGL